jgi:hypothetical protein
MPRHGAADQRRDRFIWEKRGPPAGEPRRAKLRRTGLLGGSLRPVTVAPEANARRPPGPRATRHRGKLGPGSSRILCLNLLGTGTQEE